MENGLHALRASVVNFFSDSHSHRSEAVTYINKPRSPKRSTFALQSNFHEIRKKLFFT